jgi:hypothetical protein
MGAMRWAEDLAMESEPAVIDDLVVLGRSSPDTMKDGRVSVCAAGYSRKHGFIRLYPTRLDSPLRMWSIIKVPVERNEQDARTESWKIEGSKSEWLRLSEKIKVVGQLKREDRLSFLRPLVSGCVLDLNAQKKSLGIVKPVLKRCYLEDRQDYDPIFQTTLFGKVMASDKHKYGLQPRVEYRCSECKASQMHDQQILEWGVYEWFRKYPGEEDRVWENLFSREAQQEILFLIGNLARHLSSFMVVSILRIPVFDQSKILHLET